MVLIRIICECANHHQFSPYFIHIRGKDNLTADALSRFDLDKFKCDIGDIEMDSHPSDCSQAIKFIVGKCFH